MKQIEVKKNILANNDQIADENRKLLQEKGIFTIDLVGSPGAGKTTLLEQIIKSLKDKINLTVIEGDLYTTKDADRIEAYGTQVIQVNTGGACHLEANMIREAMNQIDLDGVDLLVIENVGNLVCTASYDLSEDIKVTVLSITEGSDKPLKYPAMFQKSEVLIVNKVDLLEYTDFSMEDLYKDIKSLNQGIKVFEVSARTGQGINEVSSYLEKRVLERRKA
ncbi:hydrogenase accessory protein HypB [Orenia metallireducens]|uniref:Hydrogenase accessory protein HypB n=1 Tax=Orenia metallireducens TaxID=1413210 RepID=A0A1C0ABJ1_9FIRM|nr:hydrogenase nickel incorporation protein HypB [Orenia metallireducens]OCL27743.1 hydrogenase accessory protein HypB [Orenia metallireducens]